MAFFRSTSASTFLFMFSLIILLGGCNGTDVSDESAGENEEEPENVTENENGEEVNNTLDNAGTNNGEEEDFDILSMSSDDWNTEVLAEDLTIPWSVNNKDGVFYISERDGHIVEVENEAVTRSELQTSSPVAHEGEGGLLGFILGEETDGVMSGFAYYTFEAEDGSLENRVVKVENEPENGWAETEILLDGIPGAGIHNGGRLALGPDSMLYVTVGDADEPALSQDESNLAGSILRMTEDGEIPEDNPIENSYVYSHGHRNPQGIDWDENGVLYSSEHGPVAHDEINIIEPGLNYGWPEIQGDETADGMEEPLLHSGESTWAPSGIAFMEGTLIVTGLRGESLYAFDEDSHNLTAIFEREGRLRDVLYDKGNLYVVTNNTDGRGTPADNDDRLLKLSPAED